MKCFQDLIVLFISQVQRKLSLQLVITFILQTSPYHFLSFVSIFQVLQLPYPACLMFPYGVRFLSRLLTSFHLLKLQVFYCLHVYYSDLLLISMFQFILSQVGFHQCLSSIKIY